MDAAGPCRSLGGQLRDRAGPVLEMVDMGDEPVLDRHDVDGHDLEAPAGGRIDAEERADRRAGGEAAHDEPVVARLDDLLRHPCQVGHDLAEVSAGLRAGRSGIVADPERRERGFQSSLETFLDRCAADEQCAFHNDGEPRTAFLELMAELDENPLEVDGGRPPVNRDVATVATVQAMYSTSYWPALEESLASAQQGDGEGLLALNDAYYQRRSDGSYGNELEAFQVISCADTSDRPTVEETDAGWYARVYFDV